MQHDYREKQHGFTDIQKDHKETQSGCIQRANVYVQRRNSLRELLWKTAMKRENNLRQHGHVESIQSERLAPLHEQ